MCAFRGRLTYQPQGHEGVDVLYHWKLCWPDGTERNRPWRKPFQRTAGQCSQGLLRNKVCLTRPQHFLGSLAASYGLLFAENRAFVGQWEGILKGSEGAQGKALHMSLSKDASMGVPVIFVVFQAAVIFA